MSCLRFTLLIKVAWFTNGTVTLIKGDRVIQVKIKSKVMLINGASITMDVAPEIKSGRTMRELPLDCPGSRRQGELRRSHPDRNHGYLNLS